MMMEHHHVYIMVKEEEEERMRKKRVVVVVDLSVRGWCGERMVTRGNGKRTVEIERNVDRDDKSPSETKMGQGIGHSETCIYGVITVACLRFQNVSTKDEACICTQ